VATAIKTTVIISTMATRNCAASHAPMACCTWIHTRRMPTTRRSLDIRTW
jgi:hypothetical protein